jgi:hypothetical protein
MFEAVTGSDVTGMMNNEQDRCMENISGENHHWKTKEMDGRINRSIAGDKFR